MRTKEQAPGSAFSNQKLIPFQDMQLCLYEILMLTYGWLGSWGSWAILHYIAGYLLAFMLLLFTIGRSFYSLMLIAIYIVQSTNSIDAFQVIKIDKNQQGKLEV